MNSSQTGSAVSDLGTDSDSRLTEDQIMTNLEKVNQKLAEKDLEGGCSDGRHEHYLAT